MTCLACQAETTNGLGLCQLCQRKAQADLDYLPIYYRNLARWRPDRAGGRQVPGSRVLWDGERTGGGDRIGLALDETHNALITWARVLADGRPRVDRLLARLSASQASSGMGVPEAVRWLSEGLKRFLPTIATTDWCGELARDVGAYEARLRALTEALVPGWYAGACGTCGLATYVVPGLTWVTCRGCGTTTAARDHLPIVIAEARAWVARPKALAEAVVALTDEASVESVQLRIRQWGHRGHLTQLRRVDRDGDPVGATRYRLGDVLDRLNYNDVICCVTQVELHRPQTQVGA